MAKQLYKIIIFGPQGSGKGTQAEKLSLALKIPHISPGAMYRQIQKENSKFSALVARYLNTGRLVPDHYTNELVADRLKNTDCANGFILDGYPRNRVQAEALDAHTAINLIMELKLSDALAIERIAGRRVCPDGHTYHIQYDPPRTQGICDRDGFALRQREDETEESIKQRLSIYHAETKPLIEFYNSLGIRVLSIDGAPSIDEVYKSILYDLN
jgi:adenylate kinase